MLRKKISKYLLSVPRRIMYVFVVLVLVLSMLYWRTGHSSATTDTFTTSGTWTVPANVSSADFEAWGGGGAGGAGAGSSVGGGGGAGGGYAKKSLSGLIANDSYTVTVASSVSGGSGNGSAGNDSTVLDPSSAPVVLAKGGAGGLSDTNGGTGGVGSSTGEIGVLVYAGGSGGNSGIDCDTGIGQASGGGGGGAGSTGPGTAGCASTSGSGTALNGGSGGAGQKVKAAGNAGSNYGGGGSGGFRTNGATQSGGGGAPGLVTVTYTVVVNSAPNPPTLNSPANNSVVSSTNPTLTATSTDADSDYIKYIVSIYSGTWLVGPDSCSGGVIAIESGDETISQTGFSGQDSQAGTAYASGTTASYTVQTPLTRGGQYCWYASAVDPGGSNTTVRALAGSNFTVDSAPAAPTLLDPASGATGVSTTPQFDFRTTDTDSDNLQYRLYLYQSDCSTAVGSSPFAQASSQTGWSNQNADTNTTYTSSPTLSLSRIAFYDLQSALSTNTTYCWKTDATDSAGYGSTSATQTFTTAATNDRPTNINGNVNIHGNTIIH